MVAPVFLLVFKQPHRTSPPTAAGCFPQSAIGSHANRSVIGKDSGTLAEAVSLGDGNPVLIKRTNPLLGYFEGARVSFQSSTPSPRQRFARLCPFLKPST